MGRATKRNTFIQLDHDLELLYQLSARLGSRSDEKILRKCIDLKAVALASRIFEQLARHYVALIVPVTFFVLLCFNHYSWNRGMFHVLSDFDDRELRVVWRNIWIQFLGQIVTCGSFCLALRRWILRASLSEQVGQERAGTTTTETLVVHAAVAKLRQNIAAACYDQKRGSGVFFVVLFTQAALTTVVGVCMLMKHDGMDAKGVVQWMFDGKSAFPWKLDPWWS
ncbi:unnamed protein product [Amoebophrya sp. A120]|nr:unnamed protein product [Amoebophrya sp. A120]|eukprot:GSA120T00021683001.1